MEYSIEYPITVAGCTPVMSLLGVRSTHALFDVL
jgi:hypothetical protein